MELNNTISSVLLNVQMYFKMKKIAIDANKSNICSLAHKALEAQGVKSSIELDENGVYIVKISKPEKIWNGDVE
jgi:hypothetical protein